MSASAATQMLENKQGACRRRMTRLVLRISPNHPKSMNEKQMRVARCKADVKDAESKLREAKMNLDHGYLKSLATLEQAKATHEQEYARLKEEVVRAEIQLGREKDYLTNAEADLERGFEA